MNISSNAFYVWRRNYKDLKPASKVDLLKLRIRQIWEESHFIYGSPKITQMLARQGIVLSCSYVARLMKQMNIKSKVKRKYVATTDSSHNFPIAENTLNRLFEVKELGKKWVSDITYIPLNNHWIYLTTMIDLADRKVVGWSLSTDLTTKKTVYQAWINARKNRSIIPGFILHSDRGVQYSSTKFSDIFSLSKTMKQSMSRKGNCWDNAVAESFFKTIKCECIYLTKFKDYDVASKTINQYIQWYNTKRIHQSLGYKTPLEMEIYLRNYNSKHAA